MSKALLNRRKMMMTEVDNVTYYDWLSLNYVTGATVMDLPLTFDIEEQEIYAKFRCLDKVRNFAGLQLIGDNRDIQFYLYYGIQQDYWGTSYGNQNTNQNAITVAIVPFSSSIICETYSIYADNKNETSVFINSQPVNTQKITSYTTTLKTIKQIRIARSYNALVYRLKIGNIMDFYPAQIEEGKGLYDKISKTFLQFDWAVLGND